IPAFSNLMDLQIDFNQLLDEPTISAAEAILHFCLETPEVAQAFNQGQYKNALTNILTATAGNATFRQVLLGKIRDALFTIATRSDNVRLWSNTLISASFLAKLNAVLWVIDKGVA